MTDPDHEPEQIGYSVERTQAWKTKHIQNDVLPVVAVLSHTILQSSEKHAILLSERISGQSTHPFLPGLGSPAAAV